MNTIHCVELHSTTANAIQTTKTTCPYCGVGCGVVATVENKPLGQQVSVVGDHSHPANFGRLCIKGHHLADTLGMQTRLLEPMLGRKDKRHAISWDQATTTISNKFQQCIEQYGAESIAFYVSGQLLTEDYYVVNKFVKGYLGTANIDTNSRLCMSSAVAAHKRSFGEDIVPASYSDFEQTEMVVLVGSNTAWCHPVLYQRIMQAKTNRDICVVVIDPRFTATCEQADLHLPILPGQDVVLFNGLLQYLVENGYQDQSFIESFTTDLDHALFASQAEKDINFVAQKTGISAQKLILFYEKFAQTSKVMSLFSMGVNQSSQGVNKANAIINCHLLTGKIGKVGAAPFSMTGQPNAMGGREVGGLANMLAAHLDLDNQLHQDIVQDFWHSPSIATQTGLKAVDLFHAVEQGKIKAIWIIATNPVVSLPEADQVKRALEQCEFVVVSDVCKDTDTTQYADVLLPALGWGEKDGTVTNSERRISRQRAFLAMPQNAKPDWWALCEVAKKMNFSGFDFKQASQIFNEHAQLSAFKNAKPSHREDALAFRYFNLAGLTDLTTEEYNQLEPIQWPVWDKVEHNHASLNKDIVDVTSIFNNGNFTNNHQKAKFIATAAIDPVHLVSSDYPLLLNTGRVRDQWHTMTRTGLSANLSSHKAEPYCEIHAQDALKYGVTHNQLLEIQSQWGRCVLRVQISEGMRRGQIFAPIHWSDQFASDARIGAVVNPVVDAISGEPEFKHTPVAIQPFYTAWQGVLYVKNQYQSQIKQSLTQFSWWSKIQTSHAVRYEIADRRSFKTIQQQIKDLLPFVDESYEWLNMYDVTMQTSHTIILKDNFLVAALYIAHPELLPNRDWLASLFKRDRLSSMHRKALLAGMPIGVVNNHGPLVCSCFKVGRNQIIDTIHKQKITDEKQITACLKAGGNCGSCLPEIRGLIKLCQREPVHE